MTFTKFTVDTETNIIHFADKVSSSIVQNRNANFEDLVFDLYKGTFFDTGLMPIGQDKSGPLVIRGNYDSLTIAYQIEAGIEPVIWGGREGDSNAKIRNLAFPYKLVIADYHLGAFVGNRHFLSPVPFTSFDLPLYHVPLPNTNCRGYGGQGVGWMCCYIHGGETYPTIQDKINYAMRRASGEEAYNDGNMSETDGTRLYQSAKMPDYTWNSAAWEKKSLDEGFSWFLDVKLLMPILVKDRDNQQGNQSGKHHLTFDDAMNGKYYAYYYPKNSNQLELKPHAQMARGATIKDIREYKDFANFKAKIIKHIQTTGVVGTVLPTEASIFEKFAKILHAFEPYEAHVPCVDCGKAYPSDQMIKRYSEFLKEADVTPVKLMGIDFDHHYYREKLQSALDTLECQYLCKDCISKSSCSVALANFMQTDWKYAAFDDNGDEEESISTAPFSLPPSIYMPVNLCVSNGGYFIPKSLLADPCIQCGMSTHKGLNTQYSTTVHTPDGIYCKTCALGRWSLDYIFYNVVNEYIFFAEEIQVLPQGEIQDVYFEWLSNCATQKNYPVPTVHPPAFMVKGMSECQCHRFVKTTNTTTLDTCDYPVCKTCISDNGYCPVIDTLKTLTGVLDSGVF